LDRNAACREQQQAHQNVVGESILKREIYNSLFIGMHNSLNHKKRKSLINPQPLVLNPSLNNCKTPAQANSTTALPKTIHKSTQMLPSAVRSESAPKRFPATAAALLLAAPAEPLLLSDAPGLAFAGTASVPVATPMVLLPVLAAKVALPLTALAIE
jgi:hypothetical protein